MEVKSWPRSVYGEGMQMGWLDSSDRPGDEELGIEERMRPLTRLESTSWSCSRGWSFSGEVVAIAATQAQYHYVCNITN